MYLTEVYHFNEPWIEFEDEHMVDARRAPAVDVNPHQEEEEDEEEGSPIQPQHDLQLSAQRLLTTVQCIF